MAVRDSSRRAPAPTASPQEPLLPLFTATGRRSDAERNVMPLPSCRWWAALPAPAPRWKDRRADISEDLVLGMLAGQFIPAHQYIKARNLQRLVKEGFAHAMKEVDVIVSPTSPAVAPKIDAAAITIKDVEYELKLTRDEVLGRDTYLANITGIPAISVPCGFGEAGMPVGLQLMGRPFDEVRLYQIAYACEQSQPTTDSLCPMAMQ